MQRNTCCSCKIDGNLSLLLRDVIEFMPSGYESFCAVQRVNFSAAAFGIEVVMIT